MKKFVRIEPTIAQVVGGKYKRTVVVKRFRDTEGKEHEFTTWLEEGTRAGGAIVITKDKQVVVTHQFRAGPERWMLDIPGGGLFPGEDPEAGVMREVLEETGYVPGKIEFLGNSFRDAYTNTTWFYYIAFDCELAEGGKRLDVEENDQGAEVRLISIDQLIENAKVGLMTDPEAVLMAYDTLIKLQEG